VFFFVFLWSIGFPLLLKAAQQRWVRIASSVQSRRVAQLLFNAHRGATARRKRCVPRARLPIYAQASIIDLQLVRLTPTPELLIGASSANWQFAQFPNHNHSEERRRMDDWRDDPIS
jgi:hypothetical protein